METQHRWRMQLRANQPECFHRMDRLPALTTVALALVACDGTSNQNIANPPSRTDSAKVVGRQAASTDAFCDVHATDVNGLAFHWPELDAGSVAPPSTNGWRWVNIWATWCKPCIEEMPRLGRWRDKLAAHGTKLDLSFISIDEAAQDVVAYRTLHPETPPSLRFVNKDKASDWLKAVGLGDGAIPINLFVSPAGRIRCARAGGVREQDYPVVERLFAE